MSQIVKEEKIMLSFLKHSYPVVRIKHDNHFRRSIILEGGDILLLNKTTAPDVIDKLIPIMQLIFNEKKEKCHKVLKQYVTF